jgi:hypothetical protein
MPIVVLEAAPRAGAILDAPHEEHDDESSDRRAPLEPRLTIEIDGKRQRWHEGGKCPWSTEAARCT